MTVMSCAEKHLKTEVHFHVGQVIILVIAPGLQLAQGVLLLCLLTAILCFKQVAIIALSAVVGVIRLVSWIVLESMGGILLDKSV